MVSVYTAVVVDVWCQCILQWWLTCGVSVDCSGGWCVVSVYTAVVVDVWCQCILQWWLVGGDSVYCSGG